MKRINKLNTSWKTKSEKVLSIQEKEEIKQLVKIILHAILAT